MRMSMVCCLLVLSSLICSQDQAGAGDIYKYIDERGVVHYTNVPSDRRYKPLNLKPLTTLPDQPKLQVNRVRPDVYRINRRALQLDKQHRSSFDHHIHHAARIHKVDPLLIKAIIKTESNFNRYAVSPKGAQGLMQLMPGTAQYLNVQDPFDPWQNIYGGTQYIREQLNTFNGDIRLSLAAYNAGPTRVLRQQAIPRIPETINYVQKVIQYYQDYQTAQASLVPQKNKKNIHVRQLVTVK
jgi:soluble lytic murein transglycosylase-like protein